MTYLSLVAAGLGQVKVPPSGGSATGPKRLNSSSQRTHSTIGKLSRRLLSTPSVKIEILFPGPLSRTTMRSPFTSIDFGKKAKFLTPQSGASNEG